MNYVNDRFCELVQLPRNRQAILAMKKDVDDFLPSFCDSPAKLSRWGHHYFCDDDGGRLIFDLNSPHSHRCEICGKVYSNDVQDGVWVTFYRNRAVVLALVSAAVYKATGETKYRDYALQVIDFYAAHYHEFVLHNKENKIFDSYETMKWGCGKMMPQGLNEAIVVSALSRPLRFCALNWSRNGWKMCTASFSGRCSGCWLPRRWRSTISAAGRWLPSV